MRYIRKIANGLNGTTCTATCDHIWAGCNRRSIGFTIKFDQGKLQGIPIKSSNNVKECKYIICIVYHPFGQWLQQECHHCCLFHNSFINTIDQLIIMNNVHTCCTELNGTVNVYHASTKVNVYLKEAYFKHIEL